MFYRKKSEIMEDLKKEKEEDPSEELSSIEKELADCDPWFGFIATEKKETDPKLSTPIEKGLEVCTYYSKGFCKQGVSCHYWHPMYDCKEHIDSGKCQTSQCPNRHRDECRFYKTRKGCNKTASCTFLHRVHFATMQADVPESIESNANEKNKIMELEGSITDMKRVIKEKDSEIELSKSGLKMLKEELDKKVEEIKSKDLIIKRLEDDNESSSESSDEDVTVKKKPGLIVG